MSTSKNVKNGKDASSTSIEALEAKLKEALARAQQLEAKNSELKAARGETNASRLLAALKANPVATGRQLVEITGIDKDNLASSKTALKKLGHRWLLDKVGSQTQNIYVGKMSGSKWDAFKQDIAYKRAVLVKKIS